MRLTPEVEADHIAWVVTILEKIASGLGVPAEDILTAARVASALQHAEIVKSSMAEKGAGMTSALAKPFLQTRCPFGKYAGELWGGVPSKYLRWIISEPGIGEDEQHTARHHLELRGEKV